MNGVWSQVLIAGHAAEVYDLAGNGPPRFVVLFLHDADQGTLRDRPPFTRLFDELGLACICPKVGPCWWTDRATAKFDPQITAEGHLLANVPPFIRERWHVSPPRIGLLGVGMGGQGALRLAFKHARTFQVVAAISPLVDFHELYGQGSVLDDMYDSKEQCRQDTATMHVPPTDFPQHVFFCLDPADYQWQRGNDRLHEKLAALGVPHDWDFRTSKGGDRRAYADLMAERVVRFLEHGLGAQSVRLL